MAQNQSLHNTLLFQDHNNPSVLFDPNWILFTNIYSNVINNWMNYINSMWIGFNVGNIKRKVYCALTKFTASVTCAILLNLGVWLLFLMIIYVLVYMKLYYQMLHGKFYLFFVTFEYSPNIWLFYNRSAIYGVKYIKHQEITHNFT